MRLTKAVSRPRREKTGGRRYWYKQVHLRSIGPVNLASRVESTVPAEIQVTRSVYEHLKNDFELESHGVVEVKA